MKVSPLLTIVCSTTGDDYLVGHKPCVLPFNAAELDGLWRELAQAMPAMWAVAGCGEVNGMMTAAIQLAGKPCTHALLDVARIAMKTAEKALKGWNVERIQARAYGRSTNG